MWSWPYTAAPAKQYIYTTRALFKLGYWSAVNVGCGREIATSEIWPLWTISIFPNTALSAALSRESSLPKGESIIIMVRMSTKTCSFYVLNPKTLSLFTFMKRTSMGVPSALLARCVSNHMAKGFTSPGVISAELIWFRYSFLANNDHQIGP